MGGSSQRAKWNCAAESRVSSQLFLWMVSWTRRSSRGCTTRFHAGRPKKVLNSHCSDARRVGESTASTGFRMKPEVVMKTSDGRFKIFDASPPHRLSDRGSSYQ